MQNYNRQQQAIILKGIAQQILQMNLPTLDVVNTMLSEFGSTLIGNERLSELIVAETKQETGHLESSSARIDLQVAVQHWIETVRANDRSIGEWMQEQYDEWLDIHNLEWLTVIE